jgi:CubicO group peptidase (beta-lactamase class C family)
MKLRESDLRALLRGRDAGTSIAAARIRGSDSEVVLAASGANAQPSMTVFDLASITKLLTATRILGLAGSGALGLRALVDDYVPSSLRIVGGTRVASLLSYRGGHPPHVPLYELPPFDRDPLAGVRAGRADVRRRTQSVRRYNNLSYVLLGEVLDRFRPWTDVGHELKESGFGKLHYRPLSVLSGAAALDPSVQLVETEFSAWRGHRCRGEVHDETAFLLGGLAGHAGAFGTVLDVAELARRWLRGSDDLHFPTPWWEAMTEPGNRRGPLRSPTEFRPAAVHGIPAAALGITGFTGTSMWLDKATDTAVVILTNRVFAGRQTDWIDEVRKVIHSKWFTS